MKEVALCLKCPGSARVCNNSPDVGMILEVICAVERGATGISGGTGHPRVHLPVVRPMPISNKAVLIRHADLSAVLLVYTNLKCLQI